MVSLEQRHEVVRLILAGVPLSRIKRITKLTSWWIDRIREEEKLKHPREYRDLRAFVCLHAHRVFEPPHQLEKLIVREAG